MLWLHRDFLYYRHRILRRLLVLGLIPLLIILIGWGWRRCRLWLAPLSLLLWSGLCFWLESSPDILIIVCKSINRILTSTCGEEVNNRSHDVCQQDKDQSAHS